MYFYIDPLDHHFTSHLAGVLSFEGVYLKLEIRIVAGVLSIDRGPEKLEIRIELWTHCNMREYNCERCGGIFEIEGIG